MSLGLKLLPSFILVVTELSHVSKDRGSPDSFSTEILVTQISVTILETTSGF
jgi:hypothetical protein